MHKVDFVNRAHVRNALGVTENELQYLIRQGMPRRERTDGKYLYVMAEIHEWQQSRAKPKQQEFRPCLKCSRPVVRSTDWRLCTPCRGWTDDNAPIEFNREFTKSINTRSKT